MTFTRLIIDSGETYLLPSLSRIYHNESVAVSGLPLIALTVSTKKSGAPAVVFVELIPIVCGTYIQMCVYPVSHSALWWLCQHCPFAARLYLMDAKKSSQRANDYCMQPQCVCECLTMWCACLWVCVFIYFIYRARICLSLRFDFLGGFFADARFCFLRSAKKFKKKLSFPSSLLCLLLPLHASLNLMWTDVKLINENCWIIQHLVLFIWPWNSVRNFVLSFKLCEWLCN